LVFACAWHGAMMMDGCWEGDAERMFSEDGAEEVGRGQCKQKTVFFPRRSLGRPLVLPSVWSQAYAAVDLDSAPRDGSMHASGHRSSHRGAHAVAVLDPNRAPGEECSHRADICRSLAILEYQHLPHFVPRSASTAWHGHRYATDGAKTRRTLLLEDTVQSASSLDIDRPH
jgi:hypothetical protein